MTGSLLSAAAVPALCWVVSYPLATVLFALVVAVGRALRGRTTDRSASGPPADPVDRP